MSYRARIFLLILSTAAVVGGCASRSGWLGSKDTEPAAQTVPRSTVGAMVAYRQGLKLIDNLEYADAEPKLQQASDQFDVAGDSVHTAESTFWLGFCREKLGQDDPAREAYVSVIQRFPESKSAKSAQQRLDTMNRP